MKECCTDSTAARMWTARVSVAVTREAPGAGTEGRTKGVGFETAMVMTPSAPCFHSDAPPLSVAGRFRVRRIGRGYRGRAGELIVYPVVPKVPSPAVSLYLLSPLLCWPWSGIDQSSQLRPSTRTNSWVFAVTRTKLRASA